MRQLTVIEFMTLDGVMQGLGSPDEDRDGGFAHGGWGAPYGDEVLQAAALEGMQTTSAYLFGPAHLREDAGVLAVAAGCQPDGGTPQRHAEVRGHAHPR